MFKVQRLAGNVNWLDGGPQKQGLALIFEKTKMYVDWLGSSRIPPLTRDPQIAQEQQIFQKTQGINYA